MKLSQNESVTNDIVGSAYIENFALKVFNNADNEDRNGFASKYSQYFILFLLLFSYNSYRKTSKAFLAASMFLELLGIFGPVEDHVRSINLMCLYILRSNNFLSFLIDYRKNPICAI